MEILSWFVFGLASGAGWAFGNAVVRLVLWQKSYRIFAFLNDPRPPRVWGPLDR